MKYLGYRVGVLGALNAAATPARMRFLEAWQEVESGTAAFNAWNTTYKLPGSTAYNSAGVQNYLDALMGTAATLLTLRLPFYASLRAALTTDGLSAIEIAERSSRALDIWGSGGARVLQQLR